MSSKTDNFRRKRVWRRRAGRNAAGRLFAADSHDGACFPFEHSEATPSEAGLT